jgi:SOS-response transcriptional repressor LexA
MIRLQPASDTMEPLIVRSGDVEIRGIVAAVMRKYLPARRRPAA